MWGEAHLNGFLCVLKPPGMTSSDAVVLVRRRLPKGTKVGHAGTLDPEACGVLPVMVGKATRLFDYLVEKEKIYVAQLRPGIETDTQDAYGQVLRTAEAHVTAERLQSVLPQFLGTILQRPPMYSALKVGGRKLYDLARAGQEVEVAQRPAQIHELRLLEQLADGSFLLRVRCGRGTYVRTLCSDIGRALGCGAHMGFLLRERTGAFDIQSSHTVEEIEAAQDLEPLLLPIDAPLAHLPRVDVDERAARFCLSGNALRPQQLRGEPVCGAPTRAYLAGAFAGIGRFDGQAFHFDAMLLEREKK